MTKRYSFNLSSLQKRLLIYVVVPMIVISGLAISFGLQLIADQEEKRLKRRKGVQDTILTGSGLTQEQGASSTYKPTLLK